MRGILSAFAMLSLREMEPMIKIVPDTRKRIKELNSRRPEGSATEEQKAIGPRRRGKLPRSKRKK